MQVQGKVHMAEKVNLHMPTRTHEHITICSRCTHKSDSKHTSLSLSVHAHAACLSGSLHTHQPSTHVLTRNIYTRQPRAGLAIKEAKEEAKRKAEKVAQDSKKREALLALNHQIRANSSRSRSILGEASLNHAYRQSADANQAIEGVTYLLRPPDKTGSHTQMAGGGEETSISALHRLAPGLSSHTPPRISESINNTD